MNVRPRPWGSLVTRYFGQNLKSSKYLTLIELDVVPHLKRAVFSHGSVGLDEWLLRFHGDALRSPVNPDYLPTERYLEWHPREVFRGGGRPV